MPLIIRIIVIILLTAGLILAYPTNINTLYGIAIISITVLLIPSVSPSAASFWKFLVQTFFVTMLVAWLFTTILSINLGITQPDVIIFSIVILLLWVLLHSAEITYSLFAEVSTVIVTAFAALLWLFFQPSTSLFKPLLMSISIPATEQRFNHLVAAIGGNNPAIVTQELTTHFGTHNTDTWKNGMGSIIPITGPWPLKLFFPEATDNGNALTQGLWGKPAAQLYIADATAALQPLTQCRNAIRNLLLTAPVATKYTPFFQTADFNGASNPLDILSAKIFAWTDTKHPDALKAQGCETKTQQALIPWSTKCINPILGFIDDPDLKYIKEFSYACGVLFTDK